MASTASLSDRARRDTYNLQSITQPTPAARATASDTKKKRILKPKRTRVPRLCHLQPSTRKYLPLFFINLLNFDLINWNYIDLASPTKRGRKSGSTKRKPWRL